MNAMPSPKPQPPLLAPAPSDPAPALPVLELPPLVPPPLPVLEWVPAPLVPPTESTSASSAGGVVFGLVVEEHLAGSGLALIGTRYRCAANSLYNHRSNCGV